MYPHARHGGLDGQRMDLLNERMLAQVTEIHQRQLCRVLKETA